MADLKQITDRVRSILLKHQAKRVGLFGSVVRGRATPESDVDILVEFKETISLLDFINIKLELEDTLNRKVDLVDYQTIKPSLKDYILANHLVII